MSKTWTSANTKKFNKTLKLEPNNIKRHAGNVAQKALNTYTDMQDELYKNKGNFTLKDYGNKMLFGKPLNTKLPYWVDDDEKNIN